MFAFSAMPIPVPVAGGLGGSPAPAPALVDFIIGGGSGGTTLRAPNNVEINSTDAYPTTRNGLTFGVSGGSATHGNGAYSPGDGRFKTSFNIANSVDTGGNSQYRFDIPDGTYSVDFALGVDFTGITTAMKIINIATSATLLSVGPTATGAGGKALDATGVSRNANNWDAERALATITVTGGQGVRCTRGAAGQHFLNFIRFQQTA